MRYRWGYFSLPFSPQPSPPSGTTLAANHLRVCPRESARGLYQLYSTLWGAVLAPVGTAVYFVDQIVSPQLSTQFNNIVPK